MTATNPTVMLVDDSYGINHFNYDVTGWYGWGEAVSNMGTGNVLISSCGGSGFVGGLSPTFEKQLNALCKKVKKPEEIKSIVFVGGYNDVSTKRTNIDLNLAME